MRLMLGFHGEPGVGKDTIADHLVAHHNFAKVAFADRLKEELCDAFPLATLAMFNGRFEKVTAQHELAYSSCLDRNFILFMLGRVADGLLDRYDAYDPHTPRWMMQQWGDYRRDGKPSYFLDKLTERIELLPADVNVCVTDVRYENEAELLLTWKDAIVHLIEVRRPGNPFSESDGHSSNRRIPAHYIGHHINNSDTTASLRSDVDNFLARCR